MDLGEIDWGLGVEWIHLAEDRVRWWDAVNALMNLRVLAPRSYTHTHTHTHTHTTKILKIK
jgi:hypothetical protein